jgi:hypothetical protein
MQVDLENANLCRTPRVEGTEQSEIREGMLLARHLRVMRKEGNCINKTFGNLLQSSTESSNDAPPLRASASSSSSSSKSSSYSCSPSSTSF